MTAVNEVDRFIEDLTASELANPEDLEGCAQEEIAQVEEAQRALLPPSYRRWLERAGKRCGDFLRGSDFTYPSLLEMRSRVQEVDGGRHKPIPLPDGAFVFWVHGGYLVAYFVYEGGDEPPIWLFEEDHWAARQVAATFAKWLRAEFEQQLDIRARIARRREGLDEGED